MAGAKVVVVVPKRDPPGAPMAGAMVVVVAATTGAGVETACGAGTGVAGNVVAGAVGVGVVVAAVVAAVTGRGAGGFDADGACAGDRLPRAATVPPAPPSTTTTATVATTILFLMEAMVCRAYQPKVNEVATCAGVQVRCPPSQSRHRLYTRPTWTSRRSKPSDS
jgi:hypothetical protein